MGVVVKSELFLRYRRNLYLSSIQLKELAEDVSRNAIEHRFDDQFPSLRLPLLQPLPSLEP
jgi:hypothetical protein